MIIKSPRITRGLFLLIDILSYICYIARQRESIKMASKNKKIGKKQKKLFIVNGFTSAMPQKKLSHKHVSISAMHRIDKI
ncbi:hypothetical protein A2662_01140 [Candidatus Giovannonibacteria bacterium RIFCSPHIGHO2_01_FULL_45_33]|uniref:Uncharacterized protein n=1 Tax=Candidatus Giovannonibacteria bacterium RIFCSPLOWO2_01_FULL_45_34 TaxID=1798351 RepID=A0A1F5WY28_9BACT|nr:MAG: hypothetical protein A2662_01140 [Candidatus Giovannonibacteria bacterium RIFCSPHIGHO2_01_FULL_45_33]OGF69595.1 MAG: hypothetical protein A3C73_04640 [Candidatus Giovannonibacteria bacterium RIFCSPHIGHO2_02_FULL_44_11]OGF80565.1 MAG: hypothetical protein A2930_00880 [Candidatus Giovannonibacteria bacterium RIFCSPLOWO2_01_FULL_45_34]